MVSKNTAPYAFIWSLGVFGLLALPGCSHTAEEFTQPFNMEQFKPGADRLAVMRVVGQPESTVARAGRQCDTYQLYTKGLTTGVGSAGSTQAGTWHSSGGPQRQESAPIQPTLHKLVFCYALNGLLSDIYDQNPTTSMQPIHRVFSMPQNGASVSVSFTTEPSDAHGVQIDHVLLDPKTRQKIIYEKAAVPKESAQAGSITLDTVSREATNGRYTVQTQPVRVSKRPTTEELNTLSRQKAQAANQPTFTQAKFVPW